MDLPTERRWASAAERALQRITMAELAACHARNLAREVRVYVVKLRRQSQHANTSTIDAAQAMEIVFREVTDLIVALLPLLSHGVKSTPPLIAATLVDKNFHAAAQRRIGELRSRIQPLLNEPFDFSLQTLSTPALEHLEMKDWLLGNAGLAAFANACTIDGFMPNLTHLDISNARVGDDSCAALAEASAAGGLAKLLTLDLRNNRHSAAEPGVGDAGLVALANACAIGALPCLRALHIGLNSIGDMGAIALANAFARGGLCYLEFLGIAGNCIGNEGIIALANAARNNGVSSGSSPEFGALIRLKVLRLWGNTIGDAGLIAFADACTQNALPSLRVLWLQNNFGGQVFTNEFGVAGIEGLTAALTLGALPLLEELELVFTAGGAREALSAACAARGIRYT